MSLLLVQADARSLPFADVSVQCVVTSPPYFGLRDYGTARWEGGDPACDHSPAKRPIGNSPSTKSTLTTNNGRGPQAGDKFSAGSQFGYAQSCPCGAHRIDQQIGLEPTIDAYVAQLVTVFREVWRVLKPDGVCWLNLGDSYNGSNASQGGDGSAASYADGRVTLAGAMARQEQRTSQRIPTKNISGLKPKDLCMIPARVALALQEPYYAGVIRSERDRLWLAALVDTEGCIHVHRRPAGQSAYSAYIRKDGSKAVYRRTQDTFGVMVSVDNTSKGLVDRCAEIYPFGSRYVHHAGKGKSNRKQTLYRWTVTGQQARDLLRELYPDLVAKRQQARLAYWSDSSGDDAMRVHSLIKGLHGGLETDADSPAPPSLYEPGWYLRSEIVWGKPNPMPESVTDRPTKAHEMIYLLAKSPTYYFDADAVREESIDPESFSGRRKRHTRSIVNHDAGYDGHRTTMGLLKLDGAKYPTRNIRSVWHIATQPYAGAHFAVFPEKLVERCILAGSRPGDIVLDPFMGSGTVARVALRLGRKAIGCDLNPQYLQLADDRTKVTYGLPLEDGEVA